MWVGAVAFPFTDTLTVRVDGNVVQTFTEPGALETGYTLRTIPLNFATPGNHTILFAYHGPTANVANFNVDNISLLAGGMCVTPPRSRADFDGDGVSNFQEYLDGTDPTNANSALYQLRVLSDGGKIDISPSQSRYSKGTIVNLSAGTVFPLDFFRGWNS